MLGFPTQGVGTPTNRGSFGSAQDKKARRYMQTRSEAKGVKARLCKAKMAA
jgi:hypothetical protein